MLFTSPGTRVLELMDVSDRSHAWFFLLANALGLRYFYQPCVPNGADPHLADITVDLDRLRRTLAQVLG
jgi:hypothetical protein